MSSNYIRTGKPPIPAPDLSERRNLFTSTEFQGVQSIQTGSITTPFHISGRRKALSDKVESSETFRQETKGDRIASESQNRFKSGRDEMGGEDFLGCYFQNDSDMQGEDEGLSNIYFFHPTQDETVSRTKVWKENLCEDNLLENQQKASSAVETRSAREKRSSYSMIGMGSREEFSSEVRDSIRRENSSENKNVNATVASLSTDPEAIIKLCQAANERNRRPRNMSIFSRAKT